MIEDYLIGCSNASTSEDGSQNSTVSSHTSIDSKLAERVADEDSFENNKFKGGKFVDVILT
jgi:hypothetical protein